MNKDRTRLRAIIMVCLQLSPSAVYEREGSESGPGNNYYMTGLLVFGIQQCANLLSHGLRVEWFLEEFGPGHVLVLQEGPCVA